MVKYLYKKRLTSTLECGVFAAEKSCFFLQKRLILYFCVKFRLKFYFGGSQLKKFLLFSLRKPSILKRFSEKNLNSSK